MKAKPEESIRIQHTIGADIIMQLDDVGEDHCHSASAVVSKR